MPGATSRTLADDRGLYPRRWAAAVVMILAALMDMVDASIVNTALPSIGRDLQASSAELEWTVSAYLLGFAAMLIIAGHLGDRYGRKVLFLGGVALFMVTSLTSAIAGSAGELIASRAVQGVAAATLLPQVLASFRVTFDDSERGKAFALYGAIAGLATAAGVLLGGVLTDWNVFGWGWRTIFAINVPVAVIVLTLGAVLVPHSCERTAGRVDIVGNLVLAGALVAIVLPLVQGRSYGWPLWGWYCMAAGVLAILGLMAYESFSGIENPLLPVRPFRKSVFTAGVLIQMLFYAGMSGFFLVFTIWLQYAQGYTPTQAGLLMVAFSAGSILGAPAVDPLVERIGRRTLILGSLLMAAGLAWVSWTCHRVSGADTAAWPLVPGLVLAGIGLIFLVIPLVNTILTAVPVDIAGGASGILSTVQQFGGAVGVAVIGNVFFARLPDRGATDAIAHSGIWAVAAYLVCAALCLALPRAAVGSRPPE